MGRLVTCMMPTYNRAAAPNRCLDESVEAFLRQDYPDKQLIIVNDCAAQKIRFAHPQVRVYNFDKRAACLADVFNTCARLGDGDVFTVWTDDDIRLPWTLSIGMECLGAAGYITIGPHLFKDGDRPLELIDSALHQTAMISRAAFDRLGGYPPSNQEHDAVMDRDARLKLGAAYRPPAFVDPVMAFLIYRWGDGNYHISGAYPEYQGDPTEYIRVGQRPVEAGEFTIRPFWARDYVADARTAVLAALKARSVADRRAL